MLEESSGYDDDTVSSKPWIRGVNIGGWLLMERFITPYLFAITSCHVKGDFCWYPGQLSAPPLGKGDHEYCDLYSCKPHLIESAKGLKEFPVDEWTLASSFESKAIAKQYFEYHWDNFVSFEDLKELQLAGVTHVRVPISHWIFGDIKEDEPWIDGGWLYFIRLVNWCRTLDIQVWVDIHTAPGSQNGFDNSGVLLEDVPTCRHWGDSQENVRRSLKVVQDLSAAIKKDGLKDVVTGIGILNEPFSDCDRSGVKTFYNDALEIVRETLGREPSVFIGDMFNATKWQLDGFWTDEANYSNTFLDSHYYHVFAERSRALSPKQHIAYTCQYYSRETSSCCYQDQKKTRPSNGISRIIGEWSAAFDTLVEFKLNDVMAGIQKTGEAPGFDRIVSKPRQDFLRDFVKAQMVAYEAKRERVSSGWFYWTLKTEGGAFAEWSFLRGIREGWIPNLPSPGISSEQKFGTCLSIAERVDDDMSIVHEFPDKTAKTWPGPPIDDDYVLSHAESGSEGTGSKSSTSKKQSGGISSDDAYRNQSAMDSKERGGRFPLFLLIFFCGGAWYVFRKDGQTSTFSHVQYSRVSQATPAGAPYQTTIQL